MRVTVNDSCMYECWYGTLSPKLALLKGGGGFMSMERVTSNCVTTEAATC